VNDQPANFTPQVMQVINVIEHLGIPDALDRMAANELKQSGCGPHHQTRIW
jgi:hypothetical protein